MSRILVTGVGGPAGQNVAQLLFARGHFVVGTDMRDVSLEGITCRRVRAAHDPSFLEELRQLASAEAIDLLIPTVTEELPIVAEGWRKLSDIPAMIGTYEAVCMANDKYLTAERLARCGVTVPRFCLPSQVKSPAEVEHTIGWPCLSKPRVGRGGRGVAVHDRSDFAAITALDDGSILQEFMPGTDYAPNLCVIDNDAAIVVVIEKTKLREGIVGNAAETQRVSAPDVAAAAIAAARALGFVGPLDIDVRRRADGAPAVLEINARFGANIAQAPEVLDAALAAFGAV